MTARDVEALAIFAEWRVEPPETLLVRGVVKIGSWNCRWHSPVALGFRQTSTRRLARFVGSASAAAIRLLFGYGHSHLCYICKHNTNSPEGSK